MNQGLSKNALLTKGVWFPQRRHFQGNLWPPPWLSLVIEKAWVGGFVCATNAQKERVKIWLTPFPGGHRISVYFTGRKGVPGRGMGVCVPPLADGNALAVEVL
jgi:hypothetical protein